MDTIYHLKNDMETINALQKGMKSNDSIIGLKNTHGLFASDKWWEAIENGQLAIETIKGHISKTWPGHHGDFPEFQVTDENGSITTWPMGKMPLQNRIGATVEIDYVLQEYKARGPLGKHSECVIEVRLGS